MKPLGRPVQFIARAVASSRAFLADDSGEILTVMAVSWAVGTLLLGGAQATAGMLNMGTAADAADTMELGAIAQRQKFEDSAAIQSKVSPEKKKELYARWDAMQKFAGESEKQAFLDAMWETGEVAVDIGVSAVSPQGKVKVLVEGADAVLDAKDALYDVPKAISENNADLAPEMREYTREMTEKINGRKSAEEFLVPMRKTAAINKIADMGADSAQAKALLGDAAAQQVVRERMADAIARSYTGLKQNDAKTSYMEQAEDGAYEEFMRRQVLGTHPRELEGSKQGDVLADKETMELFDRGECDSLLAMVQTDEGPILMELKREKGDKITATSLATSEMVTQVIDEGAKGEKPAEKTEAPAASHTGTYAGTASIAMNTGAAQAMPAKMVVADDGSMTFTINYSGSGSGWRVKWMSALKWTTKVTGTVAEDGTVTGKGTRTTVPIAADGNSPPPATTAVVLTGTISDDTFTGSMKVDSWQSSPPSIKLQRK